MTLEGKPVCYLCGHQVTELVAEYDINRRVNVYTARCHGAEQVVELTEHLVEGAGRISFGLAFVPGAHPELPEAIPDEEPLELEPLVGDVPLPEEEHCYTCHGPHAADRHNTELHKLARMAGKI